MADSLPEYYFRIRDPGALVFRVDAETRNRRIEMEPIATINLAREEYKPHGDRLLSREDKMAIRAWIRERRAIEALRGIDDIHRTIDAMTQAAHWVQTQAEDVQLDEVTEPLLMAMHDLRNTLIRRRAEQLSRKD